MKIREYKIPVKIKKSKKLGNILDYKEYNILHEFVKDHSYNSVMIVDDKKDSWFKHIITYRKKSGIITDISIIIESDLDVHVRSIQRDGFNLVKK